MKKRLFKNITVLLLALLLVISTLAGCKEQKPVTNEEEKKPEFLQLLGFESYEDFTGAKIGIGNMLGEMAINTDENYITQGKGSLQVNPQGNYDEPNKHPYFKLDFLNTTCATCDFSEFKNVAFDVYNDSDEELHIRASISVGKDDGNYTTTIKKTYALQPKGWTTCTYDISEMAGFDSYDFANVRYMTFEFMEHKESRDDQVNTLYVDNLIGNYYQEGESAVAAVYNFWEGVTFEQSSDQYLVFGDDNNVNKTELSRANYAEEGIEVKEEHGEYGIKADTTESIWPKFSVRLGEVVPANTVFSFMAHIKVDAMNQDIFSFESYSVFGGNNVPNIVSVSDTVFNEWVEVTIRTSMDTDLISGFFNFDDFSDPVTGHSRFGDKPIAVYMDNMKLSEYVDPMTLIPENPDYTNGITFEEDGEQYLFINEDTFEAVKFNLSRINWEEEEMEVDASFGKYGMRGKVKSATYPQMTIYYKKNMPAESILTFKVYVKTDTTKTYYKSDGTVVTSVKVESFGNVDQTGEIPLNQWVDVKIRLSRAQDSSTVFFNFDNGLDTTFFGDDDVFVYFDNVKVQLLIQPEGDFVEGFGFEIPGNAGLFTGQGVEGEEGLDALIERVAYSDLKIPKAEKGGKYALKISHETFHYPRFRINFGEKLPKGTELTFLAYGKVNGDILYDANIFEFSAGGEAAPQFALNKWTEISITLKEDAKYIDLFWNFDRAGGAEGLPAEVTGEVYIDNVKAILPKKPIKPVGDIEKGYGFEVAGNASYFIGYSDESEAWMDATIERVTYKSEKLKAPTDGGKYALKMSHTSFYWPRFRIDFGKKLPKGTKLTFMAYGVIDGEYLYDLNLFEFREGGEASGQFPLKKWTEISITLKEEARFVDLYWNYDRAGGANGLAAGASGAVYIDNIKATVPVTATGNFLDGVGFEVSGNEALFTGQGVVGQDATIERVTYESIGVQAPTDGGSHALKLSYVPASDFFYPKFRINFGEELPKGTKLTFMAYGKINGDSLYNQSIFEFTEGGEATGQFPCGKWTELTITLDKACKYVDLYWNYERAGGVANGTAGEVYIDNVKAIVPITPEGDFHDGVGFEIEGNAALFTGQGVVGQDATIERVTYNELGVSAPTNGGKYALKMSYAPATDFFYPKFRINFGEELPAGTKLTFMAYGKINGDSLYNQSIFEYTSGGEATKQFKCDEWTELTITLEKACEYVDLYWNYERAGQVANGTSGEVYIDNVKAIAPGTSDEPEQPDEAVGDILAGYGFEVEGNEKFFTGLQKTGEEWRDATLERMTYAEAGMNAAPNGGDYVLKLSHATSYWPTFKINFGKKLAVGTKVTFMAYGTVNGVQIVNSANIFEYYAGGEATEQFKLDEWTLLVIELKEATDSIELFWNCDRAGGSSGLASGATAAVYIDNVIAVEPVAGPDLTEGVDFEEEADEVCVTGQGQWNDFMIERVPYDSVNVPALANGDSYVMKMTNSNSLWPAFQINLGAVYEAGSKVSFMAYGKINGDYINNRNKFEFNHGSGSGDAGSEFKLEEWTLITITLPTDTDTIHLCWNMDWANGVEEGVETGELYIDNMSVAAPVKLDITAGTGFEIAGEEDYITGGGYWNDFTISRVTYADAGVAALDGGDNYVMKMINGNSLWPSIQFNFGKTLPAGSKITFKAYGKINGDFTYNRSKFEFHHDSGSGNAGNEFKLNEWCDVTIVLPMEASYIQMCWNMDHSGGVEEGVETGELYIDNMTLELPITVDFSQGLDFEHSAHGDFFVGQGIAGRDAAIERTTYAAAGILAPNGGGDYALKLSHSSNYWPTFRIDFGKELAAGTTITFQAYGKITSGTNLYNQSIFEYSAGGEATAQFTHDGWKELTITLSKACEYIDLFWNYDRANITSSTASGEVYIDNVIVTEPN